MFLAGGREGAEGCAVRRRRRVELQPRPDVDRRHPGGPRAAAARLQAAVPHRRLEQALQPRPDRLRRHPARRVHDGDGVRRRHVRHRHPRARQGVRRDTHRLVGCCVHMKHRLYCNVPVYGSDFVTCGTKVVDVLLTVCN